MSKQRIKYLHRLGAKQRKRVLNAIEQIITGDFSRLDVVQIVGKKQMWRCRIGDTRILFQQLSDGRYEIIKIGPRGGMYKSL